MKHLSLLILAAFEKQKKIFLNSGHCGAHSLGLQPDLVVAMGLYSSTL